MPDLMQEQCVNLCNKKGVSIVLIYELLMMFMSSSQVSLRLKGTSQKTNQKPRRTKREHRGHARTGEQAQEHCEHQIKTDEHRKNRLKYTRVYEQMKLRC